MKTLFRTAALLFIGTYNMGAFAQADDAKFGPEPQKCKESISLFREYFKQNNFEDALPGWRYVYLNCPQATKNTFINAPKILENQINKATDPAVKKAYIDTLLAVYDNRIKYFGEEGKVLGIKGMAEFDYFPEELGRAMVTLKKAMSVDKDTTEAGVLYKYFLTGMKQLNAKKLTKEQVFDMYEEVAAVFEKNIAKGATDKDFAAYTKAFDAVNSNFEKIADKDSYVALMKPKVSANPKDGALLDKILGMMTKRKWTDDPFYMEVTEKAHQVRPSANSAYGLYEGYVKKKDYASALKFIEESVKLETDNNQKADRLMKASDLYAHQKSYSTARSKAQEAAALRPGWGEPYIAIGDLYLSTSNSCGDNECNKKYGIWAAYDQFQKAKSVDGSMAGAADQKMAQCRNYFPTVKDCFFYNLKEGDNVTVGGWIGANTTARFN